MKYWRVLGDSLEATNRNNRRIRGIIIGRFDIIRDRAWEDLAVMAIVTVIAFLTFILNNV